MRTRPLGFFEELGYRYDRGYTLNFVTAATVRRTLSEDEVRGALARLQVRHPSLALDIAGQTPVSVPLITREAPRSAWTEVMTEELRDGHWSAESPPLRCTLQHPDGASTLLVTLWHAVSDGKSGIFVMRDLLATLAAPTDRVDSLPATRLEDYLPADFRQGAAKRFMGRQLEAARVGRFVRWGSGSVVPPHQRRVVVAPVRLTPEHVSALTDHAKRRGMTLHGVLSAAIARSILAHAQLPADAPTLSFHPVDMRAYLSRRGEAQIPESVGYFISFVDAALRLSGESDLWSDARAFHDAVHGAMDAGVPRFTAAGAAQLTRYVQRALGVGLSRRVFEGPLAGASFALSNLGALEKMGVVAGDDHPLGLDALHFAGAASMTCNLCCSAVGLGGAILLNVGAVHPGLPADAAALLASSIEADLLHAAAH
ncbi:MAG: hypothetical protein KC593_00640 [Myxococcales bacterium]|nr:hypothetical protein [Myxococcales bacterium]MCB9628643.1 hypothetical protein [Sandaracinaceae bacterium]